MNAINVVTLVGHLTRDCDFKELPSGLAIATLGLAVNSGKDKNDVLFIDAKLFGDQAAEVASLMKGQQVTVTGRLKQESWPDKATGEQRTKYIVMASQVETV
jgi:single-strand DNA-binding protein